MSCSFSSSSNCHYRLSTLRNHFTNTITGDYYQWSGVRMFAGHSKIVACRLLEVSWMFTNYCVNWCVHFWMTCGSWPLICTWWTWEATFRKSSKIVFQSTLCQWPCIFTSKRLFIIPLLGLDVNCEGSFWEKQFCLMFPGSHSNGKMTKILDKMENHGIL